MGVNSYKINRNDSTDKQIVLPISIDWDFAGKDDSIELYEDNVIKDIVGSATDYEIVRFAHKGFNGVTDINHNFNFYLGDGLSNPNNWKSSFLGRFGINEIYYNSQSFIGSFFKLDLYDTITDKRQKNYLTIILNPNKSKITNIDSKNINYPSYTLDYGLSNEGFYIYWLGDESILNIDTLYMSCKFYDAKVGSFVRMMNKSQATFSDKYNFDYTKYFYYKVIFNYIDKTYNIFDMSNNLVGNSANPINWFEYVNP